MFLQDEKPQKQRCRKLRRSRACNVINVHRHTKASMAAAKKKYFDVHAAQLK